MFYITSKILAFLIKPIFWIFLLLISAYVFENKRKRLLLLSCFMLYIFSNGFIADELLRIWEMPHKNLNTTFDVGIVLGGISAYDKNTKTHNFNKHADRLFDAEELYYKGVIKKIMLSGGNGLLFNNGYMEANILRDYLLKKQIPKEDIIIESSSRNTKENAINSVKILKTKYNDGRFLLITSAGHIKRAQLCFKKAGLAVTPYPTDCITSYRNFSIQYILIPRIEAIEKWEDLIHEWIGYIVYRMTL